MNLLVSHLTTMQLTGRSQKTYLPCKTADTYRYLSPLQLGLVEFQHPSQRNDAQVFSAEQPLQANVRTQPVQA